MVDAKNLFKRHQAEFDRVFNIKPDNYNGEQLLNAYAILYGASIIAEAIRNEQDETEFRVKE